MQVGLLSALLGARSAKLVLDLARMGNAPEDIRLLLLVSASLDVLVYVLRTRSIYV